MPAAGGLLRLAAVRGPARAQTFIMPARIVLPGRPIARTERPTAEPGSRRPGRVRRGRIWSVTSDRGRGCRAHRSRTAAAGTAGSPGAGTRPDGPVRPGPSAGGSGRQLTSRTLTCSAGKRATGRRMATGAATRMRLTRAALPETGGLPVLPGLTARAARPSQMACDPTTAAARPPPGRTGGGAARMRMPTRATTNPGLTAGASLAATMTRAGCRMARVPTVRRGHLVRSRRVPGLRNQRHGGSFRRGRTAGALARPVLRGPVVCRPAS